MIDWKGENDEMEDDGRVMKNGKSGNKKNHE